MSASPLNLSAADRPLPLRTRGDWQMVRVEFSGQPAFVATDPVTLATVQLSAEEHFLWERLREPTSLSQLRRAFEHRFAPRTVTETQLQQFLTKLHRQALVVSDRAGQGAELIARDAERRRAQRRQRLLQVFSIRLGGFRAGPAVDALYRIVRPAFSWAGVIAGLALLAAAMSLLLTRGGEMAARLPGLAELLAPSHWLIWAAAILGVKLLHELGHALALRHFGGHCREIGVLLLAGMPTLYCDASDAWRLPSKYRRMAVSGAGVVVELLLAAAAVLLWNSTPPGLFHSLALSVAIVCSVHTVAINANPLLRYDGYYMLADWLEVPNLADRSRGLIRGAVRRWLLAEPGVDEPLLAPAKRRALVVYAVASAAYGVFVLALIVAMLLRAVEPYRAERLVYLAAALAIVALVFAPLRAAAQVWRDPNQRRRLRQMRLAAVLLALAAGAWGAWNWPMVQRAEAPAVLVAADAQPVFVTTAGRIEPRVALGAEVHAGDLLATFANPDLQQAAARQEGEVAAARVRVEQLRTLRAAGKSTGAALPTALAELADAEAQLAQQRDQLRQLEIRSSTTGQVLPPPARRTEAGDEQRLGYWTGHALRRRNCGAWLESGTPLAVIEPAGERTVHAALDPADVPSVAAGQPARVLFDQAPLTIVAGEVRGVTRRIISTEEAQRSAAISMPRPHVQYVAEIVLVDPPDVLLPAARATVKIETQRSTLGRLVRRELSELFRLPW